MPLIRARSSLRHFAQRAPHQPRHIGIHRSLTMRSIQRLPWRTRQPSHAYFNSLHFDLPIVIMMIQGTEPGINGLALYTCGDAELIKWEARQAPTG
jgi:hypothetical protein